MWGYQGRSGLTPEPGTREEGWAKGLTGGCFQAQAVALCPAGSFPLSALFLEWMVQMRWMVRMLSVSLLCEGRVLRYSVAHRMPLL